MNESMVPQEDNCFVEILKWKFIEDITEEYIKAFQIPKEKIVEKYFRGYCIVYCNDTNSLYLYEYSAFEKKYFEDREKGYLCINIDGPFTEKLTINFPIRKKQRWVIWK